MGAVWHNMATGYSLVFSDGLAGGAKPQSLIHSNLRLLPGN